MVLSGMLVQAVTTEKLTTNLNKWPRGHPPASVLACVDGTGGSTFLWGQDMIICFALRCGGYDCSKI